MVMFFVNPEEKIKQIEREKNTIETNKKNNKKKK
jgi:hypothetical protein